MMKDTTIAVVVDGISRQGDRNLGVTLVSASGGSLPEFRAGAHIDLHLREGLVRQYSIASSPSDRGAYLICVRRASVSRGGSEHVHSLLRVGEEIQISAPRNLFELRDGRRHVLMAGGIGITPLVSMAEVLEETGTPFELHYYVAERKDVCFARRLARGFTWGQISIHCHAEGEGAEAFLPQSLYQPDDDAQLYLCGPAGFMTLVHDAAVQHGWSPDRIHREAFTASPATVTPGADTFEVQLAGSGRSFTVHPHESIADVLLAAGINVPLSCGMGICGACLTTVIAGIVDHRDSVQSDAEKAADRQSIAVCCSRSASPLLVIDL